jgi:hypothetical protein
VAFDTNGGPYILTADCTAGFHAIAGGGISDNSTSDFFAGTYPATSSAGAPAANGSTNPRYWAVAWRATSNSTQTRTAYAICVPD